MSAPRVLPLALENIELIAEMTMKPANEWTSVKVAMAKPSKTQLATESSRGPRRSARWPAGTDTTKPTAAAMPRPSATSRPERPTTS